MSVRSLVPGALFRARPFGPGGPRLHLLPPAGPDGSRIAYFEQVSKAMLELKALESSDLTEVVVYGNYNYKLRTKWMLQSLAEWHRQRQERGERFGDPVLPSGVLSLPPSCLLDTWAEDSLAKLSKSPLSSSLLEPWVYVARFPRTTGSGVPETHPQRRQRTLSAPSLTGPPSISPPLTPSPCCCSFWRRDAQT